MQTLMNQLRIAAARFSPGRAVVVAMLLGPLVGALLAYGATGRDCGGNDGEVCQP
jgi:hypothetical protein